MTLFVSFFPELTNFHRSEMVAHFIKISVNDKNNND
uniref:Uncharacterized protein n=1 Tax=Heterorhabditis bacteriophora TaxID=37862 RepID=A0A1I7WCC0_HETBA